MLFSDNSQAPHPISALGSAERDGLFANEPFEPIAWADKLDMEQRHFV